jgi:short-subunit dehydrogenase
MAIRLKKLRDQVIVITGASSGIGLSTARMAARQGAALVLAARSGEDLAQLVSEITSRGSRAIAVTADVAREEDVQHIADEARRVFGGFDTWVNNAGASVYGRALEVSVEDMRRLFDTNVWGVVYGSRVASEELRRRGGALINVGSEVSDQPVPLQVAYSASKHAVKAWTDGLRMELESDGAPMSVTLIKPGPIDTPYPHHAANYLEDEPTHAPPVYKPEAVARAILHAATTPVRELFVGGGAKFASTMHRVAPQLSNRVVGRMLMSSTHSGKPRRHEQALHTAGGGLRERGDYEGMVRDSLYTRASMHPVITGLVMVGTGLLVANWVRGGEWGRPRRGMPTDDSPRTEPAVQSGRETGLTSSGPLPS